MNHEAVDKNDSAAYSKLAEAGAYNVSANEFQNNWLTCLSRFDADTLWPLSVQQLL